MDKNSEVLLFGCALETIYAGDVLVFNPANGHTRKVTKEDYEKLYGEKLTELAPGIFGRSLTEKWNPDGTPKN